MNIDEKRVWVKLSMQTLNELKLLNGRGNWLKLMNIFKINCFKIFNGRLNYNGRLNCVFCCGEIS